MGGGESIKSFVINVSYRFLAKIGFCQFLIKVLSETNLNKTRSVKDPLELFHI